MPYRDQEARRAYNRKHYAENRDRLAAAARSRRSEDREGYNRTRRERYAAHPEHHRHTEAKARYRSKYGLSEKDVDAVLQDQAGRCAICQDPMQTPAVDHDHSTGKFRGLLCRKCNTALGMLKDDPAVVLSAHEYLSARK